MTFLGPNLTFYSRRYGLIEPTYRNGVYGTAYPCRGLFLVDPNKTIRLMSFHPWSIGRSTKEILRSIDSLQMTDSFENKVRPGTSYRYIYSDIFFVQVCTQADWEVGQPAMVDCSVTPSDINALFQSGVITWFLPSGKQYMRTIADPSKPRSWLSPSEYSESERSSSGRSDHLRTVSSASSMSDGSEGRFSESI